LLLRFARRFAPLALVSLLAAPAAAAQVRTSVAVAIADESPSMFDAPAYQALHLKRTRYFIPWNAVEHPAEVTAAATFVATAALHHVSVLMHISTDTYTHGKAKLPSVAQYRKDVGALIAKLRPLGVKEWGVWNEANHVSEPTHNHPRRAAQFFATMRSICQGCTIVALDVLDTHDSPGYTKRFYAALSPADRARANLVGIHNYGDVNRHRTAGTQGVIDAVHLQNRRAQFWLTETGGLVNLAPNFPCSTSRAAARTTYMFTLARQFRRDVKRLYIYSWTGTDCANGFDAGLVDAAGKPRPAYAIVKRNLSTFTR
jgi:hypothetical protein